MLKINKAKDRTLENENMNKEEGVRSNCPGWKQKTRKPEEKLEFLTKIIFTLYIYMDSLCKDP